MAITRQLLQTVAFVNQASTSFPCSVPNHSLRSTSNTIIYTKPSKVKLISFLFNLPHHLLLCVVTVYLNICLYKYWRPLDFLKGKGSSTFFIATFPQYLVQCSTWHGRSWFGREASEFKSFALFYSTSEGIFRIGHRLHFLYMSRRPLRCF